MAAAAGGGQTAKRKKGGVVWASGGGGLLLLGGGLLAATAALGVAFFVRAAIKRKWTAKGSLQEAEQKRKRSTAACGGEGVAERGEEREGIASVLPPPPPQAALPPRQVKESSGSTATGGEPAATAREFDFARAEERVIKESSPVGGRRGGGGGEDPIPAIVNKAVVVNEPKIIQVVGEVPPSAASGGREGEREEDEGSPVADGADETSAGEAAMAGAEPPETTRPAKATQPTLASLEVVRSPRRVAMSIKEKVFVWTEEKQLGAEEAKPAWKESRMAREMRAKGVMDKMAVETREKGFSRNAQMVILVSTLLFTTLMAILLHHYSRFPASTQHV